MRILLARAVSLSLLLPAGLVCVSVPFWMLTLPGRWEIFDDTSAAFGAGTEAGRLRAAYVDCTRERSGSNSSRGIGITEYSCVIDLSDQPEPAPIAIGGSEDKGGDSYAGMTYEEAMAEHTRSINAALEAVSAQSRARSNVSNRLERKLATDRSGHLPAVRILSAQGEPRRVGLVWGYGELAWRWTHWLTTGLLFFGFGGSCLFAVWVTWKRRRHW